MATQRWRGDALAQAQVTTVTIGTNDVTTTYKVTINGKTISILGQSGTNATTAAALLVLLQAATVPQEFKEMTWTVNSNVITATAAAPGKPFTLSTAVSAGTGTISNATTTTSSGPNDVSIAANWVSGSLPATGDDIVFDGGGDVLYNLQSQIAITPNSITVLPSFSGKIGLPAINNDNQAATYQEYRQTYLQYGTSGTGGTITVTVNGGAGRIKIDNNNAPAVWNILTTGRRLDTSIPACLLKSTNASVTLNISKGDVAVGWFAGETSTLSAVNIDYQTSQKSDSSVWIGSGVTLTSCAIDQTGGSLEINGPVTGGGHIASLLQYAGTSEIDGTIALDSLNLVGGTCVYNSTGTLGGTVKVANSATLDFSQDIRPKTISNPIELYGTKCSILDPHGIVNSGTMAVGFNETADSSQVDWGINFRLSRSTTP